MAPVQRNQRKKNYTTEDMEAALESLDEPGMNLSKAARIFGIPRQTLHDRYSGKYSSNSMGRKTELTAEEEKCLVDYIKYMGSISQPLTIPAIKVFAWAISNRSGRPSRFNKETGPGHTWWWSFRKRHHHEITLRKPDSLNRARGRMANSNVMKDHFNKLEAILKENGLMNKPQQIFNCDESGIEIDARKGKVVVSRNTKHSYSEVKGTKCHATAHVCCSASGLMLPPMIIFERTYPSGDYASKGPMGCLYAKSPNGCMDGELFTAWFEKIFLRHTPNVRPLLLIFDGHASHITLDVIDMARANNIILHCLPPHTTHILQPLDVAIFRPIKQHFSKLCGFIQLATLGQKNRILINKTNFTAIFREAFGNTKLSTIQNGFRKCGIFPFDPNAIDKSRLLDGSAELSSSAECISTTPISSLPGASFSKPDSSSTPASPSFEPIALPTNLNPGSSEAGSSSITLDPLSCEIGPSPSKPDSNSSSSKTATFSTVPEDDPSVRIKNFEIIKSIIPERLMSVFIYQTEDLSKRKVTNKLTEARTITSDEHRELLAKRIEEQQKKEEAKAQRLARREERKRRRQSQNLERGMRKLERIQKKNEEEQRKKGREKKHSESPPPATTPLSPPEKTPRTLTSDDDDDDIDDNKYIILRSLTKIQPYELIPYETQSDKDDGNTDDEQTESEWEAAVSKIFGESQSTDEH